MGNHKAAYAYPAHAPFISLCFQNMLISSPPLIPPVLSRLSPSVSVPFARPHHMMRAFIFCPHFALGAAFN